MEYYIDDTNCDNIEIPEDVVSLSIDKLRENQILTISDYNELVHIDFCNLKGQTIILRNLCSFSSFYLTNCEITIILEDDLNGSNGFETVYSTNSLKTKIIDSSDYIENLYTYKLILNNSRYILDDEFTVAEFFNCHVISYSTNYENLERMEVNSSSLDINSIFPTLNTLIIRKESKNINFNDSTFENLENLIIYNDVIKKIKLHFTFENLNQLKISGKSIKELDLKFSKNHDIIENFYLDNHIKVSSDLMRVIPLNIRKNYELISR